HLALRMSYEDVIRVAHAKIDPARLKRIAAEMRVKPGSRSRSPSSSSLASRNCARCFRPGSPSASLATPSGAACLRACIGGWRSTAHLSGFLRFWLLAKLRGWRPKSYRYQQEQHAIEAWLRLVDEAARLSSDLALEVAECARLIKGYGDTLKRGSANYRLIEARIIRPTLAGHNPP